MRRFASTLILIGSFILIAALGWWWLTYGSVIGYAYISVPEAGMCLFGDSDICRLARALCRSAHPLPIIDYSNAAFWVGVITLFSGLFAVDRKTVS